MEPTQAPPPAHAQASWPPAMPTSSPVAAPELHPAHPEPAVVVGPNSTRPAGDGVELHRLAVEQRTHDAVRASTDAMVKYLQRQQRPGQLRGPFVLNAQNVRRHDEAGYAAHSITVLNYGAIPVFLGGPGGAEPVPNGQGIQVGAGRMLTLPIEVLDLDMGVDPATILALTVVVFVVRHETLQPAYAGAL